MYVSIVFFKSPRRHPMPSGPFLASRKLIGTNLLNNNLNFQIRCCSPHIGLTFYKENCMDIITTFGVRGKIKRPLKKIITPVRGLQILSPSRILLYYRGASFNIKLSKLVNSLFKNAIKELRKKKCFVYNSVTSVIIILLLIWWYTQLNCYSLIVYTEGTVISKLALI